MQKLEIIRCPKHDLYHGGRAYGVKRSYEEGFCYVGTEKECQQYIKFGGIKL